MTKHWACFARQITLTCMHAEGWYKTWVTVPPLAAAYSCTLLYCPHTQNNLTYEYPYLPLPLQLVTCHSKNSKKIIASYPGPSHAKIEREKKGLVSTLCACARFSHFFGKQDSSVYFQDTKNIKTSWTGRDSAVYSGHSQKTPAFGAIEAGNVSPKEDQIAASYQGGGTRGEMCLSELSLV